VQSRFDLTDTIARHLALFLAIPNRAI